MKGETAVAYAAFCEYRDMGLERSLEAVKGRLKKSFTLMGRWSRRWSWVERVRAHDNMLASESSKAAAKAAGQRAAQLARRRVEVLENDWKAAEGLREKADLMERWPLERREIIQEILIEQSMVGKKISTKTNIYAAKWSLRDVAVYREEQSKLARMSAGMETDRTRVDANVLQRAPDDQVRTIGRQTYRDFLADGIDEATALEIMRSEFGLTETDLVQPELSPVSAGEPFNIVHSIQEKAD